MLKNKIEALLFSAGKGMPVDELAKLTHSDIDKAKEALQQLKWDYEQKHTSLMVVEEGNFWKITIKEEHLPLVRSIVTETELSKTLMETLAVIAFKYPIKQSELIKIRTNKAYDHLKELEEMGYITRQKYGRTKLIRLTQQFFGYFSLPEEKLKEEFKDFQGLAKAIESKEDEIKKIKEEQKKKAEELKKEKKPELEVFEESPEEIEKEEARGIEVVRENIGGLEVVDEPEEEIEEAEEEPVKDTQPEEEVFKEEIEPEKKAVEDISERIAEEALHPKPGEKLDPAVEKEIDKMLHPPKEEEEEKTEEKEKEQPEEASEEEQAKEDMEEKEEALEEPAGEEEEKTEETSEEPEDIEELSEEGQEKEAEEEPEDLLEASIKRKKRG